MQTYFDSIHFNAEEPTWGFYVETRLLIQKLITPQLPLSQELKFPVIWKVLVGNRAQNKAHGPLHAIS